MTALLDARPPGLDALFRAGNVFTVTLNWPAGTLVGRTFVATHDGATLTVSILGDVMTITMSAAQTAVADDPGTFVLTETTGGLNQVVITGRWMPSPRAAATASGTVTLAPASGSVSVTVAPSIASAEVRHDWAVHGWTPFTAVTMTADPPQTFSQTVVNGRGVLTGTQTGGGSLRIAYLRAGTLWTDSEITSLIVGPSSGFNANAQQGHIHRVRQISPGLWEGIAAWTAVVGGGYETINTRGVRFDGTTLFQSTGDAAFSSDIPYIDRKLAITTKSRTTAFGLFFNNHNVHPTHLYGLVNGDIVTIASSDSTFNETNIALNGATPSVGVIQVIEATTLSTSALAVDSGTVTPSGNSGQKRFCPYWMSTRVRGGTTSAAVIEVKRWRPEEGEPDWGDPRVVRANVATNGSVPSLATGPGLCALWGAHFVSTGPTGTFGGGRYRQVVT